MAINGESAQYLPKARVLLQRAYTLKKSEVDIQVKRGDEKITVSYRLPVNSASYTAWRDGVAVVESAPQAKPIAAIPELESLVSEFSDMESQLDSAVVAVSSELDGDNSESLATLFAPGNLLVSKSSLVGSSPQVKRGDKNYAAEVISRDDALDLVLLKIATRLPGGLKLTADQLAPQGHFLLSPHPDNGGRIGVTGTRMFSAVKPKSSGFLGVEPKVESGMIKLVRIVPNSPAAAVLKVGDFVLAIDGEDIASTGQFISKLSGYNPGDRVAVRAQRDGQPLSVDVVLAARPTRPARGHIAEYFEGGKSERRDNLVAVFSHDGAFHPEEAGGALFTIDGDFIGVNIARYSRTRSYAVPADKVINFVKKSLK